MRINISSVNQASIRDSSAESENRRKVEIPVIASINTGAGIGVGNTAAP